MSFAFIRNLLRKLSSQDPPSKRHLFFGGQGERAAARFLRRRGHRILCKNYRCRAGEIDLVSQDGDSLVFTEVKTRSSCDHQDPLEIARRQKWVRVERAARHYMARARAESRACRFDLVTIHWPGGREPVVEHYENAYVSSGW